MIIQVKKLHHLADLPVRAHADDAGADVCACTKEKVPIAAPAGFRRRQLVHLDKFHLPRINAGNDQLQNPVANFIMRCHKIKPDKHGSHFAAVTGINNSTTIAKDHSSLPDGRPWTGINPDAWRCGERQPGTVSPCAISYGSTGR